MATPRLTLITGGARSGKSAHAIALASAYPGSRRHFLATAEPSDNEMRVRIERHRADRPAGFVTIEEPLALATALESLEGRTDVVVLDCLTLWVANLMAQDRDDSAIIAEAERLVAALTRVSFGAMVVTGEVGAGIVPANPAARRFRDLLGWTNQKVARVSDRVLLMAAGYPLIVK
ncbi:MAG: bifunctional adenosylcobinamide kinase/adenosylcobinamide-phosphate guanylyltransferase [Candidatus Binataceae bacterium]